MSYEQDPANLGEPEPAVQTPEAAVETDEPVADMEPAGPEPEPEPEPEPGPEPEPEAEPADTAEPSGEQDALLEPELDPERVSELERIIEALLFLSPDPVTADGLAGAAEAEIGEIKAALDQLEQHYLSGNRGLVLKQAAGGWSLASHPDSEEAARNLLARPRTPPLTAAQAETLAIIAYLQPVSRPEIARIRGVNAESAAATLLERGIIEESGRSQFGAVLYRTTDLFLRLFGLNSTDELPPISAFDPSPELEEELRERLLRAGEARVTGA